ncbi:hypothetical protein DFH09DRAFT_1109786 [Mycena vulgaris]|nr:hypothetical protein DFH09DRAFT_1109786 [Mycena vulgaris]
MIDSPLESCAVHFEHSEIPTRKGSGSPLDGTENQPLDSANGATLRTLFCFANLVFVSLSKPLGFDLDDTDISDRAAVGIWKDSRSPDCGEKDVNIAPPTCLQDIDVRYSPIIDAAPVPALLSNIFPETTFEAWDEDKLEFPTGYYARWGEMKCCVGFYSNWQYRRRGSKPSCFGMFSENCP